MLGFKLSSVPLQAWVLCVACVAEARCQGGKKEGDNYREVQRKRRSKTRGRRRPQTMSVGGEKHALRLPPPSSAMKTGLIALV